MMQEIVHQDHRIPEVNFTIVSTSSTKASSSYSNSTDYCERTFNVIIHEELLPTENLAITGNCRELGNWKPELCILLDHQKGSNQWSTKVQIPQDKMIEYRYFVCMIDSNTNSVIVRRWETHLQPRTISKSKNGDQIACTLESYDIFGNNHNVESVHRGWLTNETILQLKIQNTACQWEDNKFFNDVHIKITPMSMEKGGIRPTFIPIESSSKAIVECVKFEYGKSFIRPQSEFGVMWKAGDIVIFHITVNDLRSVAYLIEIYGQEVKENDQSDCNKFSKHLGYYYLLPDAFNKSDGEVNLPIMNSITHQKLGTLNVSYLIIKPLSDVNMNLRTTCTTLWKSQWTGLDIGHRGVGVSYRISSLDMLYPENTIASLKAAALNGADMIEFDVHVTKDGIPIVYHDFHVNISHTTSSPRYGSDLIPVLIKDLTYDELKNLKIYHLLDGIIKKTPTFENCSNPDEYNLFPKLEDIFNAIDSYIGFDIEIKWPQQLIDGTWESQQTIDKNSYVDNILKVILLKGYGRCMILSCFDADICTMLRFKQNIYPVLFLTLGPTKRYPLYMDSRCNSIEMATCLVQSMEFLGIIPHTEDILNNSKQLELCKNLKQIIFCWGDDSNCKEIIDNLKNMGINGVIYDRIDKIVCNQNKKKIFMENYDNDDNNDDDNNDDDDRDDDGDCTRKYSNSSCYNEFFKFQYIEDINDEDFDQEMM